MFSYSFPSFPYGRVTLPNLGLCRQHFFRHASHNWRISRGGGCGWAGVRESSAADCSLGSGVRRKLFVVAASSMIGGKMLLAEANALRGDFHQLVLGDELDRLLERKNA